MVTAPIVEVMPIWIWSPLHRFISMPSASACFRSAHQLPRGHCWQN